MLAGPLDAEFPAVAARRLGLDRVPLLCAREIAVPGSLPRVIRLLATTTAPRTTAPRHTYLKAARAAQRSGRGTIRPMALDFAERIRRIPRYPVASGYDLERDKAMLASNESPFGTLRSRKRRGSNSSGTRAH